MPTESQDVLTPVSTAKKIKHYAKFCVLVFVAVVAIVIVPGYYVLTAKSTQGNKSDNSTHPHQETSVKRDDVPWYLPNGKKFPDTSNTLGNRSKCKLLPRKPNPDQIVDQLTCSSQVTPGETKVVVLVDKISYLKPKFSDKDFSECPVNNCKLSDRVDEAEYADAVLFTDAQTVLPNFRRNLNQVWIVSILKSPFHSSNLTKLSGLVNWTATYRYDSDLVHPYGTWVYYNKEVQENSKPEKNYAAKKTKKAVWFVADRDHDHNGRKQYVDQLSKHINVDIFSSKDRSCPCETPEDCFKYLSQYKFYLSFENVNCVDYITEKFFVMLQHEILPVVMGARPKDYERVAPKNSFIHVDHFSSPKELAEYLHRLDQNDDLYNSYFKWKGTGDVMIDTKFICRLCNLLHANHPKKSYDDLQGWWMNKSCTQQKL